MADGKLFLATISVLVTTPQSCGLFCLFCLQYGAYGDFALQNGLISQRIHDGIALLYPACRLALDVCNGISWSAECILAVTFCQTTQFGPVMALHPGVWVGVDVHAGAVELLPYLSLTLPNLYSRTITSVIGMNVYDIRKKCEGPLCYDFSNMEAYLNLPEVRKQLGVGDRAWTSCSMQVSTCPLSPCWLPEPP
jgi:hypothetical protein